jgi:hypothetical protein
MHSLYFMKNNTFHYNGTINAGRSGVSEYRFYN